LLPFLQQVKNYHIMEHDVSFSRQEQAKFLCSEPDETNPNPVPLLDDAL
jgi:hypothetical protein